MTITAKARASQPVIEKTFALLACTECGAEAYASCNCHKAYKPVEMAAKAILANPGKSNRAIAKDIGVSEATMRRARTASGDAVDQPRTGLDGKTRKQPKFKRLPDQIEAAYNVADSILDLKLPPQFEKAQTLLALGDDLNSRATERLNGAIQKYSDKCLKVAKRSGAQEEANRRADRAEKRCAARWRAFTAQEEDGEEVTVEDDLEPDEYREPFMMRTADAMSFAVYSGGIDDEVIAAANRVAEKWAAFARDLARKKAEAAA